METEVMCPYCGERIWIDVDEGGGGAQRYTEDCTVCCKPMEITVTANEDGDLEAVAQRGDD